MPLLIFRGWTHYEIRKGRFYPKRHRLIKNNPDWFWSRVSSCWFHLLCFYHTAFLFQCLSQGLRHELLDTLWENTTNNRNNAHSHKTKTAATPWRERKLNVYDSCYTSAIFFLQVQLVHKQRKHCDIEWSFPRDYVTHQDWNSLEFGTTTSYLTAAFATWVSYVAHAHVQNYLCAWTSQLTAALLSLLVKFVTLSILESCYIFDVQWSNTQSWLLAYYLLS